MVRLPQLVRRAWCVAWFASACGVGVLEAGAAPRVIRVWSHQGQEAENQALRAIAAAFDAHPPHAAAGLRVELTFFPDFQFTEKLAVAAAARDLPDTFDLDGPLVARFVAADLLAPLDAVIPPEERTDFLPTVLAQGTVGGRLYALGAFDSAVVLYYDRVLLAQAGVTPPPDGKAWSWPELVAACERLQAAGLEPVALHLNESADEWFTYAFAPVVWSGGGALIAEPAARPHVRGVLASDANIAALRAWQVLFTRGFAATDPVDPDPFARGRTALDWNGHWVARSHRAVKGERLGAMPLPVLGVPVAPCGSWCWVVSARAREPEGATAWLRWVTARATGVTPLVRANGAIPARRSAFADFPEYATGAGPPYPLFRTQLETVARPRPRTPFYATLTQRFAAALRDIARGADVAERLRTAEDEVQRVIDRRVGRAEERAAPATSERSAP